MNQELAERIRKLARNKQIEELKEFGDNVKQLQTLERIDNSLLYVILHSYAIAGIKDKPLFSRITDELLCRKDWQFHWPIDISLGLWGMAVLNYKNEEFIDQIAKHLVAFNRFEKYKRMDFSYTLWAFASLGIKNDHLFHTAARCIVKRKMLKEFLPSDISTILRAFAMLGIRNDNLLSYMNHKIARNFRKFNSTNMYNTLVALHKLGGNDIAVYRNAAFVILDRKLLDSMSPHKVAHIIGIYGNLRIREEYLLRASSDIFKINPKKLNQLNNDELFGLVSAFGKLNVPDEEFLEFAYNFMMKNQIMNNSDILGDPNFVSVVWTFAKLGIYKEPFFNSAASLMLSKKYFLNCEPKEMSEIIFAYCEFRKFGHATVQCKNLLEVGKTEISKRRNEFSPPLLSDILYSLAQSKTNEDVDFFAEILSELQSNNSFFEYSWDSESICKTVWSFVNKGLWTAELLNHASKAIFSRELKLSKESIDLIQKSFSSETISDPALIAYSNYRYNWKKNIKGS